MKLPEKLQILQERDFGLFSRTMREEEMRISDRQGIMCVCGRLATGLHESHCRKFQTKVQQATVQRLWRKEYEDEVGS